jgi:TldD protein
LQRRDFLALTGLTAGGLIVPSFFGKVIAAEQLHSTLDPALKKRLADAALAAARQGGRPTAMCASGATCASS